MNPLTLVKLINNATKLNILSVFNSEDEGMHLFTQTEDGFNHCKISYFLDLKTEYRDLISEAKLEVINKLLLKTQVQYCYLVSVPKSQARIDILGRKLGNTHFGVNYQRYEKSENLPCTKGVTYKITVNYKLDSLLDFYLAGKGVVDAYGCVGA